MIPGSLLARMEFVQHVTTALSYGITVERCAPDGKQRLPFTQKTHWRCTRSDAAGMTRDGRWRCTRIMSEVRSGQPTNSPDEIRADIFDNLDDLLKVLEGAIQYRAREGGEDI